MATSFSEEAAKKLDALIGQYPTKQAVCLPALHLAQKEFGYLSDEALRAVADYLGLSVAHVYGVCTFYTMFRREPAPDNVLRVCTNVACMLRGAYDVLAALEKVTGVRCGDKNDEVMIVEEECIAACANAPAIVCGTKYFLDVEAEDVAEIVNELREKSYPESEVA